MLASVMLGVCIVVSFALLRLTDAQMRGVLVAMTLGSESTQGYPPLSLPVSELECALEGWFPVSSANFTAEGGADLWSSTIRRLGPPYPCV